VKNFTGKRAAYARAVVDALENALAVDDASALAIDQLADWTEKHVPDCYRGTTAIGNGGGSAIRRAVNDAIAKLGVPVCASNSGGYYIAEFEYQVAAECAGLVKRAHAILGRAVALRAAFEKSQGQ
jgi:hypothetical protein